MSIDTSSTSKKQVEQEEPNPPSTPLVIDGISYIPSSALLAGIPKVTLKDNQSFGVLDTRGESPRIYSQSELGFYYCDTRYLSTWETTFNGQAPVSLSHDQRYSGNTVIFSMTNRDMPKLGGDGGRIARDTFLIRRIITLWEDTLYEILAIRNYDSVPHVLQVEQWAGGHFNDVFEVRGFPRLRRGRLLPPEEDRRKTVLSYQGLDGRIRRTYIQRAFEVEKIRSAPYLVGHFTRIEVPPKQDIILKTIVSFDKPSDGKIRGQDFETLTVTDALKLMVESDYLAPFSSLSIETDHEIVNRAIKNSKIDVQMLLSVESIGKESLLYPHAGVPWFSAPFGRDGIITAYQMLPWYSKLARGVLDFAFNQQGKKEDPFTDEEPGKVFHEYRRGEMAKTREVPFIPYFGSVDSTPLALILLHEYITWTLDMEKLKEWWPSALAAVDWMDHWGDRDKDLFLEYLQRSPNGLINQGWKDSHDSIMHHDGKLAQAPIRLCEVQGYAYRARMGMASLARLLGHHDLATKLRLSALQLRAKFSEFFWDAEREFIYLALDGARRPCSVLSSNMGHCLWTEILLPDQAEKITRHLMSDAMFSGHGIRTLADTEIAYNPLSYHNGSVWPHDNSLIMEGFRNYGHGAALERLATALIGVLESSDDFRLPELYCGFRKRANEPPIPYEVACKPQAWAAGTVHLMLKSMLGISMDVDQNHLVFHSPNLTPKINSLEIKGLRGRDWEMNLAFKRSHGGTTAEVTQRSGRIRVLTVK